MKVTAAVVAVASAIALVPPCLGFLPSQSAHVVRSHQSGSSTNAAAAAASSSSSPLFMATGALVDDPTFTKPDTLNDGMIGEQACTDAASLNASSHSA